MTTIAEKNFKLISVWISETEEWHYFKNDFKPEEFKDGYVAYEAHVQDGIIIEDSYNGDNVGKPFIECYSKIIERII